MLAGVTAVLRLQRRRHLERDGHRILGIGTGLEHLQGVETSARHRHLKESNGSAHARQRWCDLHGVEPNSLICSVGAGAARAADVGRRTAGVPGCRQRVAGQCRRRQLCAPGRRAIRCSRPARELPPARARETPPRRACRTSAADHLRRRTPCIGGRETNAYASALRSRTCRTIPRSTMLSTGISGSGTLPSSSHTSASRTAARAPRGHHRRSPPARPG